MKSEGEQIGIRGAGGSLSKFQRWKLGLSGGGTFIFSHICMGRVGSLNVVRMRHLIERSCDCPIKKH